MKLSAALIVRDCSDTLEACLQSVRPHVDEIVCVDTGSIDDTPAIARKYADRFEVFLDCNDLKTGLINDFAMARNRSFSLVTGDWCLWIDSDDVLEGGEHLRHLCNAATTDNVLYLLPYHYSHDEKGRCTCIHFRERLIRPPHQFHWVSPVHEVLVPIQPIQGTIQTVRVDDLVRVIHRREKRANQGEPGRNLRILRDHVAKRGESDVRSLYYLGLEYGYAGDLGNSIRYLRRYAQLSNWHDEKCLAVLELSRHLAYIGDHEEAINWALQASVVRAWPEPYWRLGKSFYALANQGVEPEYNFKRAAHFFQLGLTLGDNDTVLFVDPRAKYEIHEFLNVCLSRIGDTEGAIRSCEAGLAGYDSEPLRINREVYRRKLARKRVTEALDELGVTPAQRFLVEKTIDGTFQVGLMDEPTRTNPAPNTVHPRVAAPGKLDLVFLVGHQLEPWNPETVAKTGIGGSETMAMELSKRLAAKGHRVRLYGHCTPTMEGVFDGVEYLDATKYHDVECDVLIASRKPSAVDDEFHLKAKARVLWVHDVHVGPELNMVRDLRFDRILCLSNWHKEFFCRCYPSLDSRKVIVTRNGIDLSRFEGEEKRNPYRVVYSSSPDRGLKALLEMWPEILKQVPDAELHVFYGLDSWRKTAELMQDADMLSKITDLEQRIRATPRAWLRGRINQNELARQFMKASVWAYPTWFSETSCITAQEAQAAGLRIVTSNIAALRETVGVRGHLIDWGNLEREDHTRPTDAYMREFIGSVVSALTMDGRFTDRSLVSGYAWARFSLDTLADDWDTMLTDIVKDVTARVVPAFVDVEAAE